MFERILKLGAAASVAVILALTGIQLSSLKVSAANNGDSEQHLITIGLTLAPDFLNLTGADLNLVGLGSFIVNAQADCNGCHVSDGANEYVPNGNPYFLIPNNKPLKFNQKTYMAGGSNFGPVGPGIVKDATSPLFGGPGLGPNIISRNLTPDYTGYPEGGNDFSTFLMIMRTGHDFDEHHLNCGGAVTDNCYTAPVDGSLLQVMPWPNFRNMTDHQLLAIWSYLRTIPCNPHNDDIGDMFPWLKNTCKP